MPTSNDPPPWDEIDDAEPSQEELAEAAQLARALDRGTASAPLPEDALEAAALLSVVHEPTLGDERAGAIFEGLQPALDKRRERSTAQRRGLWLWWLGTALGAAALLLYVQVNDPSSPEPVGPGPVSAVLPAPSVRLLEAQAALLAEGTEEHAEAFEREMSLYRVRVLAALEER